jgi:hypothetical protein
VASRRLEKGIAVRRIGGASRTPYRCASGDVAIPEPAARLLRLLVLLRLTMSEHKFNEIVKQLN